MPIEPNLDGCVGEFDLDVFRLDSRRIKDDEVRFVGFKKVVRERSPLLDLSEPATDPR